MKVARVSVLLWEEQDDRPVEYLNYLIENDDWINGVILKSETKYIDHDDFYGSSPANRTDASVEEVKNWFDELVDREKYLLKKMERLERERDRIEREIKLLRDDSDPDESENSPVCDICEKAIVDQNELLSSDDTTYHISCRYTCSACGEKMGNKLYIRPSEVDTNKRYHKYCL